MRDFAVRAIRAQPGDYLRTVARDAAYNFAIAREDRYEYDTADKWSFFRYLYLEPSDFTGPAYQEHEGVKADLKKLVPEDAKEAIGHGLRAKRSKSGAISFDLISSEAADAPLQ